MPREVGVADFGGLDITLCFRVWNRVFIEIKNPKSFLRILWKHCYANGVGISYSNIEKKPEYRSIKPMISFIVINPFPIEIFKY